MTTRRGGPRGDATERRTLRDLERAGLSLRIECRTCRKWAIKGPHWFGLWIRDHGGGADDIALSALAPRLKCSCGAKAAKITIDPWVQR